MTVPELITLIFGALFLFWIFVWIGDFVAKTPKLFFYGKFRKFFR